MKKYMKKFGNSKHLGLYLLAPAGLFVFMFFLAPVVLTGVFGFTNMSTSTGISGGAYLISENSMLSLVGRHDEEELAEQLSQKIYTIDEAGLAAALEAGGDAAAVAELEQRFLGQSYISRRDVEAAIKTLDNRPSRTRDIKTISAHFERSVINIRYETGEELLAAVAEFGIDLSEAQATQLVDVAFTGWHFTTQNFEIMFSLPDTQKTMLNTLFYVFTTLILFNTGFAGNFHPLYGGRRGRVLPLYLAVAAYHPAGAICADVEMAGMG